jgi:hypothetical protein
MPAMAGFTKRCWKSIATNSSLGSSRPTLSSYNSIRLGKLEKDGRHGAKSAELDETYLRGENSPREQIHSEENIHPREEISSQEEAWAVHPTARTHNSLDETRRQIMEYNQQLVDGGSPR